MRIFSSIVFSLSLAGVAFYLAEPSISATSTWRNQAPANWFPTSAPTPGFINASYTNKVIERAKKKRHAHHQGNTDVSTRGHKPGPGGKSPGKRLKITEKVFPKFVDYSGKAINGVHVHIELMDAKGLKYQQVDRVTGSSGVGTVSVQVSKFPSVVTLTVPEGDRWEVTDQSKGIFTITGAEGSKTSKTTRELRPNPISLALQIATVNIDGPPHAEVHLGNDKEVRCDDGGRAAIEVPMDAFEEQVSINVRRTTEGGTFLGSFNVGKPDSNGETKVDCRNLPLVALTNVRVSCFGPDELTTYGFPTEKLVLEKLGKPSDFRRKRLSTTSRNSKWLEYPDQGLAFKVRSINGPSDRPISVVERIRITSSAGGGIGALQVSDGVDKLSSLFGDEGATLPDSNGGKAHSFLDEGVIIHENRNQQIDWIDLNRPLPHLSEGADLGIPNVRAKVFIEPVDGDWEDYKSASTDLIGFLESCPGMTFVQDQAQADTVIQLSLQDFNAKKDRSFAGFYSKYQITESLNCQITEVGEASGSPFSRTYVGNGIADFEREVDQSRYLVSRSDFSRSTGLLMRRGAERAKRIAMRQIASQIVEELTRRATFTARLTSIEEEGGSLEINAGKNQGLIIGSELEIYNSGVPAFKNQVGTYSQSVTLARVTELTENTAKCQAYVIVSSVGKDGKVNVEELPIPTTARRGVILRQLEQVLDPSTRMATAKPVYRIVDLSEDQWDESGDKGYVPTVQPTVHFLTWPLRRPAEELKRHEVFTRWYVERVDRVRAGRGDHHPNGPVGHNPNGPVGHNPNGPVGHNPNGPVGHNPNGPVGHNPNGPVGHNPNGLSGRNPNGHGEYDPSGPDGRNLNGPGGYHPNRPRGYDPNGPVGHKPTGLGGYNPNGPSGRTLIGRGSGVPSRPIDNGSSVHGSVRSRGNTQTGIGQGRQDPQRRQESTRQQDAPRRQEPQKTNTRRRGG